MPPLAFLQVLVPLTAKKASGPMKASGPVLGAARKRHVCQDRIAAHLASASRLTL
jgi:hypothetical protein